MPPAPAPPRITASAPVHAPSVVRAAPEAQSTGVASHAPVATPHAPSTIRLAATHEPPPPLSKADPKLVDFAKASFRSKTNDPHERPYRLGTSGEGPESVRNARVEGAAVFVVTRGPDGKPLPPENRLFIVRKLFSTEIHDGEGNVVARSNDQVPAYAADYLHSVSADWSGKPLGAALKLPASAKQAPNPSLPVRNPGAKATGGGSDPYTVPLAGTKTRVFTKDAATFYAGGEETTNEADWGGRAIINQPSVNGRSVPPRVVNMKAIVDARTGEPVTKTLALEIDGQLARYEPRTSGNSRPDLTLDQFQAL